MSMKCIAPETPLLISQTGVWRGKQFFGFLIQNIDCGYTLEPHRLYLNVLSRNVKNTKFFSNEILNFQSHKNISHIHTVKQ